MMEEILKNLVDQKKEENTPDFLILNFLKEYLQYPVLDFLYKNNAYRDFIFTGGSCLRICHELPRLSEDLDLDLEEKELEKLDWDKLEKDITRHFKNKYLLDIQTKKQEGKRIYLKFPILNRLNLSYGGGSDFLYVKIEPGKKQFPRIDPEVQSISNFGYNFIIKKYPLNLMMTGKIKALFTREWFQGDENEIDIKGRDFFDLFWFFQNNIEPDYEILKETLGIKTEQELKKELTEKIRKKVTADKLKHDLKSFLPDRSFAKDFCNNYQEIMKKYLN